jgi:transposase
MASSGRRAKRFLSAEQKYDLWVRMLTGQLTTVQAAAEAGVDRTTIATLKRVARDGAIAALEASKPGRRQHTAAESAELARLNAVPPRHLSRARRRTRSRSPTLPCTRG